MVYLGLPINMVIFHGYVTNNPRVYCFFPYFSNELAMNDPWIIHDHFPKISPWILFPISTKKFQAMNDLRYTG